MVKSKHCKFFLLLQCAAYSTVQREEPAVQKLGGMVIRSGNTHGLLYVCCSKNPLCIPKKRIL